VKGVWGKLDAEQSRRRYRFLNGDHAGVPSYKKASMIEMSERSGSIRSSMSRPPGRNYRALDPIAIEKASSRAWWQRLVRHRMCVYKPPAPRGHLIDLQPVSISQPQGDNFESCISPA
jgi:hypothetical protein